MAPQRRISASLKLQIVVATLLVSAGCYTSHDRTPYIDAGDVQPQQQPSTDPLFDYDKEQVPFTNHVEGTGATSLYEHRWLEIPSSGDNNQPDHLVTASYYRSTLPGSHPLVIVLPIWGTYTYPSRKISSYIQRHSDGRAHVLHIHGERYLVDWDRLDAAPDEEAFLEVWREAIEHQRVSVTDVRRLIDWMEQRSEIDTDRIGMIGFSFAAAVAGTILTQEPRLSAGVLVMGGALQHVFVANCSGKRLTAVRDKAARDFSWTADDLERLFEPIMRDVDPSSYPGQVDPRKVLIIDASRDDCMIEPCRESMWQSLGRPERLTMNYDHRAAFYSITPLGLNWMRPRIWEFLEERLLP